MKRTVNCYCPTHDVPLLPLSCLSGVWPGVRARLDLVVGGMLDYMQLHEAAHCTGRVYVHMRQVLKACTPSLGNIIGK